MAGGLVAVRHSPTAGGAIAFTVETDGGVLAMSDCLVELTP